MNFSKPQLITDTLKAGDEVERKRSANRDLVTNAFAGKPYMNEATAKKWGLSINFNCGEAPVLAAHARRQYDNAILGGDRYFKISIPLAPEEKKSGWGSFITNYIGTVMKDSTAYECVKEYQIAALVSHGIGPETWRDPEDWCTDFVAPKNLRLPTDTLTSFEGQEWVDERHDYSPGELERKVFGKNSDDRWNKTEIKKILEQYDNVNYSDNNSQSSNAENRSERWNQDLGYYSSDAVPSISLHHFYYRDNTDPKNSFWKLCVIPDWAEHAPKGATEPVFLYESGEKPFAKKLENFLSIQTGDLNPDAPQHIHAMRSLGFSVYEPCFYNNLALCRQLQYLLEMYNPWFRVDDPANRARPQMINLAGVSVLEKGTTIVPNTERHHVDPQLIESTMAKLKQLQSEASQSYTQSTDTGTAREQTAFETRVKLSAVNAMMTGLLGRYFRKAKPANKEICRRFCLRGTSNEDAKEFQKACEREDIPRQWLDVKYWKIEPEVPMGSGNPTMAQTMVDQLLGDKIFPRATPTAQAEIMHEAIEILTNDSRKAERWQPTGKESMLSDGKQLAGAVFGSLMTGVPVATREGVPPADLIETWLGMMSGVISRIEQTDNMGTMPEIVGLQNVAQSISQQIQKLAQDQTEKQRVKGYGDDLGKLMNLVKAFGQRLAEKNAQSQMDPEAMAKIEMSKQKTQADIANKQAKLGQAMHHKDVTLQKDQQRKDTAAASEQQRNDAVLQAELAREDAMTGTEISHQTAKVGSDIAGTEAKTQADIASGKARTKADVANMKKKAKAAPKAKPK